MYEFARFAAPVHLAVPSEEASSPVSTAVGVNADDEKQKLEAERHAEWQRLRAAEQALRLRNEELELQVEAQERKLAAATRSVARTRTQVTQLTAKAGLKDIQGSRNSKEVHELRMQLADREAQLQDALDDCDAALSILGTKGDSQDASREDEALLPPAGAAAAAPSISAEDEESLLQLMRVTEELTDALEIARAGEEDARRQLTVTSEELQREEQRAQECSKHAIEAKDAKDREVAALLARLKAQEQELVAERARCVALQVGATPKVDYRGSEPEGEPAGGDSLDTLSKVDISDREVEAAERAARAAIEAMKLHGTRSASKAGVAASKAAGHLSNVANGGLLKNLNFQVRSWAAWRSAGVPANEEQKFPPQVMEVADSVVDADFTQKKPLKTDWNNDPIEV
jgi:hypothetical protein